MHYTPKLDYILRLSGNKVFNPDIEGGDAAGKMFTCTFEKWHTPSTTTRI